MGKVINTFFIAFTFCSILLACGTNTNTNSEPEELVISDPEYSFVKIDTSFSGIKIYYPAHADVGLIVGDAPDTLEAACFCCAATYTKRTIMSNDEIVPNDIAGDYVMGGKQYSGYTCINNTGGFVFYGYGREDGKWWEILDEEEYLKAKNTCGTAFEQELLLYKGQILPFERNDDANLYRALCNFKGELCIIDGTHLHKLSSFVDLLKNIGVTDALYLNMGNWSYSWYLEGHDEFQCSQKTIHKKPDTGNLKSSWLVFYYVN